MWSGPKMGPGSPIAGSPPTRNTGRLDIGIAARQRATIHDLRLTKEIMTSPYLDDIRSTRKIIEELIGAREAALVKASAAAQRRRVERDLIFLRDALARIDGARAEAAARGNPTRAGR